MTQHAIGTFANRIIFFSPPPADPPTIMGFAKTAEPFVCGGSAATFASVIIHPIDLAKVCLRLSSDGRD